MTAHLIDQAKALGFEADAIRRKTAKRRNGREATRLAEQIEDLAQQLVTALAEMRAEDEAQAEEMKEAA